MFLVVDNSRGVPFAVSNKLLYGKWSFGFRDFLMTGVLCLVADGVPTSSTSSSFYGRKVSATAGRRRLCKQCIDKAVSFMCCLAPSQDQASRNDQNEVEVIVHEISVELEGLV